MDFGGEQEHLDHIDKKSFLNTGITIEYDKWGIEMISDEIYEKC